MLREQYHPLFFGCPKYPWAEMSVGRNLIRNFQRHTYLLNIIKLQFVSIVQKYAIAKCA